ncbi:hypothetical protein HV265_12890 [Citrobacter sp. RHBSTW-00678]|uniref:hypothetical protein n=1 Tax=Citrobacter sp. RHBSTW-00678 TaxID=2742661 RepID=UPI0015EA3174|nr:hypothetical protein [Citrobacter sp. RHBSTW-00678]QLV87815.1 hypothetical protein HV265_12890 [Citrobacter sp. RHBSTW-00678]
MKIKRPTRKAVWLATRFTLNELWFLFNLFFVSIFIGAGVTLGALTTFFLFAGGRQ